MTNTISNMVPSQGGGTGGGGSGGSWELISTTTVSSTVSSVDLTGLSAETYYKVVFKGLKATALSNINVRVFRGSTLRTDYTYRYTRSQHNVGTNSVTVAGGNGTTAFKFMGLVSSASSGAGTQGELYFYDTDSKYSTMYARCEFADGNDNDKGYVSFGSEATDLSNTLTGLRFLLDSGSYTAGTFSLYSLVTS